MLFPVLGSQTRWKPTSLLKDPAHLGLSWKWQESMMDFFLCQILQKNWCWGCRQVLYSLTSGSSPQVWSPPSLAETKESESAMFSIQILTREIWKFGINFKHCGALLFYRKGKFTQIYRDMGFPLEKVLDYTEVYNRRHMCCIYKVYKTFLLQLASWVHLQQLGQSCLRCHPSGQNLYGWWTGDRSAWCCGTIHHWNVQFIWSSSTQAWAIMCRVCLFVPDMDNY